MSKLNSVANILPGASSLGYGFNIATAVSTTTFTQQIINLDEKDGTVVVEGGIEYLLPANVSQFERHESKISYSSFTSEDQYRTHMAAEASASGGGWGFSAEFSASYSSLSKGDNTNFYGLVEAKTTLWDTQLKSITGNVLNPDFMEAINNLPPAFSAETQRDFFSFFDVWGTHIVNQSTAGGSLSYLVTSDNSSQLSESAATASMSAEYKSLFVSVAVSAEAEWDQMASGWISSRNSQLSIVGGSPEVLSGVIVPTSPTWQPDYSSASVVDKWSSTLIANPGVINIKLTPISNVLGNLAKTSTEAIKYESLGDTLAQALEVYLDGSIKVSNTSTFVVDRSGGLPILTGTTTSIVINRSHVKPTNPPQPSDISMYWLVMADEAGVVQFNQNANTENPDDLDELIQAAVEVSDNQKWWVCICLVNQAEAPISIRAVNWLNALGIETTQLVQDGFYPGMCGVATMIGKTNYGSYTGRINHYQPDYFPSFPAGVDSLDITVETAIPAFVNIDG
ncbi:MAC/perforin domain-containing protein [Pseudomonas sp. 1152_12]|uniref:MAC/perforin domain-containing protein n=1 Tax=Pseudomonas sp. 1152_12 TaxID=2604455 RepID=UPI004064A52E